MRADPPAPGRRIADFLLLRCVLACGDGLAEAARACCAQADAGLALHRLAREAETGITYLYAAPPERAALDEAVRWALHAGWLRAFPDARQLEVSRLARVFDAPGRSRGEAPEWHYVVEMDPEEGWMPELSRWYDEEHMPGLASVPGTVHAMRLLNPDHAPLSLACYDLATRETLGSPPWLAVRGTPWSDVMRPRFRNTRRTMMKVLA